MQKQAPINKRAVVSSHFLFRKFSPAEIDRILAFARERRFSDKESIFCKGAEGASMMIVLQGRVMVSLTSDKGKEITLNYIEAGGILGEISLLDGRERSANATALGACTLLFIDRSEFIPFLRANADLAVEIVMVLCEKLRNTSDLVGNIGLLPVPVRLAHLLAKLAQSDTGHISPGTTVSLSLSQQEMGNLIGTSRESVNRTLALWQADGWIGCQQDRLVILKPNKLREVISETVF